MSAFAAVSCFSYVNILERSSFQRQVYTFGIMQKRDRFNGIVYNAYDFCTVLKLLNIIYIFES